MSEQQEQQLLTLLDRIDTNLIDIATSLDGINLFLVGLNRASTVQQQAATAQEPHKQETYLSASQIENMIGTKLHTESGDEFNANDLALHWIMRSGFTAFRPPTHDEVSDDSYCWCIYSNGYCAVRSGSHIRVNYHIQTHTIEPKRIVAWAKMPLQGE